MNHNGYFAVKLDESWQDVVKRNATMEVVRGDHMTLGYKPEEWVFDRLIKLSQKELIYISELRRNENIEHFGD